MRDMPLDGTAWLLVPPMHLTGGAMGQRDPDGAADDSVLPMADSLDRPPETAVFDAERARLEAAIAAARRRVDAARHRAASREAAARNALQTELEVIRQRLADLERSHRELVGAIQAEALAEAERILDDARRRIDGPPEGGAR